MIKEGKGNLILKAIAYGLVLVGCLVVFSSPVVATYFHIGDTSDACFVCHDFTKNYDCSDCHEFKEGYYPGDSHFNLRWVPNATLDYSSVLNSAKFTAFAWNEAWGPTPDGTMADGNDTKLDGVCEVCHTKTYYHTNTGDGTTHFDGQYCSVCHPHFQDYYFAPQVTGPQSHDTHIHADKGPKISDCTICHDPSDYSQFADDESLATTSVCDACHSPGGVYNGVNSVSGSVGAKDNWINGVYSGDALATGKEKWCAGCHDNEPAFSSSNSIQIIMDEDEATYVGTWPLISSTSCAYDGDFRYNDAGTGSETATWIPDIPESGDYDVYVRWKDHSNRASNAPYTVFYDGGSDTVYKDCRINGCQWNLLGTYPFAAGTSGYIQLTDNADGYLNADAIMITQSGTVLGIYAPNVIGDNATYGFYATGHGAHGWVECLSCHNTRTEHIDHEHRTYASASNNYQTGYRLAKPLVIPRPNRDDLYANLDDFELCNDCHNPYEVLGVDYYDESRTNFRADAAPIQNGHNVHIKMKGKGFDSDWDWVRDSTPTCIACHNVHGPPNQAMVRHGELMSTYGTLDKVPGQNFSYMTSLWPNVYDSKADVKDSVASTLQWEDASFEGNGFCNGACHGTKTMVRVPYLGPKVLTKKAYPSSVPADGAMEVLITALVADHNDNVPSDGVAIDLTPIDGGVETMYDDGLNGGDLTAGDNVYSYTLTVPSTVGCGIKSLLVTATDPDGVGESSITLRVQALGEIILDNTEATYVGSWTSYSNSELYEGDGQYHEAGCGANTASWTPLVFEAGYYNVYAWWHSNPTARASDAPYTINYNGGSETIDIDQSRYGGLWVLLGTYPFTAGTSGSVVLSDDADSYVIADAVKFERADPNVIIRDDLNAVFVGTWPPFTNSVLYGGEAQYHETGSGANTATWTPLILEAGYYNYARWAAHSNRATDAPYTINYDGGSETIDVNQEVNGGQWVLLGTYPFAAGTSGSVVLSDDANEYVNADAIKFELE